MFFGVFRGCRKFRVLGFSDFLDFLGGIGGLGFAGFRLIGRFHERLGQSAAQSALTAMNASAVST